MLSKVLVLTFVNISAGHDNVMSISFLPLMLTTVQSLINRTAMKNVRVFLNRANGMAFSEIYRISVKVKI